ncbi:putative cytochrome P450 pisatin demethylase [Aspergillus affinis]|uniref:putative cytochrome P450 pisatin demethylase n=1 Tax=Aspergillus affinis TaxID=1070780 RepID=UPI0022FDB318|nr:cytochrome P450 [Aspergillus affinis]KAI9036349.1 cytochrome P450 [Aspergillus affinis]
MVVPFIGAALIARVVYLYYFHPLAKYPGPFLARFTNICNESDERRFFNFLGGQHHLTEWRLHEQHGPVVRVAPNWLSFSTLEDFEAIYGFNKSVEKDEFYGFGKDQSKRIPSIFATKSDAVHRQKKRKILSPALTSFKSARYAPIVPKHVDVLLARVEALSSVAAKPVNLAPLVHQFTVDTMLEVIFGPALASHSYTDNAAGEGLLSALRQMSKLAWSFSLWPAFGWIMNTRPIDALLRRPVRNAKGQNTGLLALLAACGGTIFGRSVEVVQHQQPGILKSWLEVPLDDATRMNQDELLSEAFNLVFAGPGSTSATITALLYQLGTDEGQGWQDRLRMAASDFNELESSTTASLPLELQAVIKETLRLHAAFPTAFPRVIRPGAETIIARLDSPLPVGTRVSANTYVLGQSREIWGDTADQWLPQRWLGDESQRRDMDSKSVAFSKGARGCAGKDLAWLVIAQAVMATVRRWRIRAVGELRGKGFVEMQYDDCWVEYEPIESS